MIHVDVTKFANIPDGGGHKFVGRKQGQQNSLANDVDSPVTCRWYFDTTW